MASDAVSTASAPWITIGSVASLLSSHRHHITLRTTTTQPTLYHSILLFSFTNPAAASNNGGAAAVSRKRTWYAMVSQCPHLGAPLESAPVRRVESSNDKLAASERDDGGDGDDLGFDEEDGDDIEDAVIICPWHEYDFDLRSGESSTGLQACTYQVRVVGEGDEAMVEVESMVREDDARPTEWEVTEVRAVSEAFPDRALASRQVAAESLHMHANALSIADEQSTGPAANASSSVLPPEPRPRTLIAWACLILNTSNPATKVAYTRMAADAFRSGDCKTVGGGRWQTDTSAATPAAVEGTDTPPSRTWISKPEETPPHTPPREAHITTVRPGQEAKRGKWGTLKSRIAMLHSLANIELWAIDLGWDIIARSPRLFAEFCEQQGLPSVGQKGRLPLEFYNDFVKLAVDEAKHFSLLVDRLGAMGANFGDLEVHQGLWDTALQTEHALTARLSIIHLVNEARGLDVNPVTIMKFQKAGDEDSTKVLEIIHRDEVTHVTIAHRHLLYLCSLPSPPLNPIEVFRQEVRQNFAGRLKGPFNATDRAKAGMGREWYEDLVGERNRREEREKEKEGLSKGSAVAQGVLREEIAGG